MSLLFKYKSYYLWKKIVVILKNHDELLRISENYSSFRVLQSDNSRFLVQHAVLLFFVHYYYFFFHSLSISYYYLDHCNGESFRLIINLDDSRWVSINIYLCAWECGLFHLIQFPCQCVSNIFGRRKLRKKNMK